MDMEIKCDSWQSIVKSVEGVKNKYTGDDVLWFRGVQDSSYKLLPSLMRDTEKLSSEDHYQVEQDLFFGFQAHASDLRRMGLTEWECLFFGRHYGLPTRLLDWTDTLGVALYFAVENWIPTRDQQPTPAVWILNPLELNEITWDVRDIILPRYLGIDDDGDYLDFGEMLALDVEDEDDDWEWEGPVAIYPVQLNDRVRAQRGWFTIHGKDRRPLEDQYPKLLTKLIIDPVCIPEIRSFFEFSGFNCFSIYTDHGNLARWLREKHVLPMLKDPA